MIFLVDNYDSFTFNLFQHLSELGAEVLVRRNDRFTLDEVEALAPEAIVISPGPGRPSEAGLTPRLIERFAGRFPILGVCLGHQAIGEVFGGRIVRAPSIFHGKVSAIEHDGRTVFAGLPNPLVATRYHSLVVAPDSVPSCLEVSARTADDVIMGLRHRELPVEGVQFHPESALTPDGKQLLANFLAAVRGQGTGDRGQGTGESERGTVDPSPLAGGSRPLAAELPASGPRPLAPDPTGGAHGHS